MNENKVNIVVPRDYNGAPIEIVLREGKAADQLPNKEPITVETEGTIEAPFRWLEKKIELIDQKKAHIQVSRDEMCISLIDKENDYYANTISGKLKPSKEMTLFGINTDKHWEPAKLSQFCKMQRAFFKNKAENMALVSTLKNFKAKVAQDIERSKEEKVKVGIVGEIYVKYSPLGNSHLEDFLLSGVLFVCFSVEAPFGKMV